MKRRQFLQTGSMVSLPVLFGGLELAAMGKSSLFDILNNDDDRVLVIVRLQGGNDGLNTIIPMDQYASLSQVRPNLMIAENKVLKLTDKVGIHPGMSGIHNLFNEERLAVIQGVAYPNQNRSHFRSTDIWSTGSDADKFISTGWAGRYLDQAYPGFPDAYPNEDVMDPIAITVGNVVSETCQGSIANFGYTLLNQDSVRLVEETVAAPSDNSCYGQELEYIRTSISQSNSYAMRVMEAFEKGNSITEYPADNALANQMKMVAQLISGGLQTKIYVVTLGGFDTHANQVLIGESELGVHATLLERLSGAISAFVEDCNALGIGDRVLGMTFSEFGRQIRANNSFGTDHGTAAPMIVFGNCAAPGVIGQNAEISPDTAPQEGVPMQYDFRSVYASVLIDWFGATQQQVEQVLFKDFQKLPVVRNCSVPSNSSDIDSQDWQVRVYPNPCSDFAVVEFENKDPKVHVSLFDVLGSQLEVYVDRNQLSPGHQSITLPMQNLARGSYYVRIAIGDKVKTWKIVKI